jgi:dipeptidyl aminopeptidase/acylaminoacyl peptidase
VVYNQGLELHALRLDNGAAGQLTQGGNGCHWPQFDPTGRFIAYSRVLRDASAPDSTAGIRILDLVTGDDRALMRTATRPWHAVGVATWSPTGDSLAFFNADSLVAGMTRLVLVHVGGGDAVELGWTAGVPGGVAWSTPRTPFLFDTTPAACPVDESERATWAMHRNGLTERYSWELGDRAVFAGYPFAISPGGDWSVHTGQSGGVGVVMLTSTQTGENRVLTQP